MRNFKLQECQIQMKKTKQKHLSCWAKVNITLNFPAFHILCSFGRGGNLKVFFFHFRTLSYITLIVSYGKLSNNKEKKLTKICPTAWSYSIAQYVKVDVITQAFPVA